MELRHDALTKLDALLISVAGSAPANSLAVSTAALVAAVGLFGPGAILFGALPMFGIAIAFYYLNVWRSDAGASYAWVGRALHPALGFLAGWSIFLANIIFMVAGSYPAATATLDLIDPRLTTDLFAVTALGAVWFAVIAAIALVGIRSTAQFQKIVTSIEIAGVLVLAASGIAHGIKAHAHFSAAWFSPLGPGSIRAWMAGALVALFYFWGWDVSVNLTEETVDRNKTPGLGALGGMLIILGLFVATQVSIQLTLTPAQIAGASSNVLESFANAILPAPWGDIAIIVVIISTVGTLETSLLVVSRTMMSMSRDGALGPRFGELHPRFATPWFGSLVFAGSALALFAADAMSANLNAILNQSVNAIGVQIAIYYGLAGAACAWHYRNSSDGDAAAFWLRVIWPAAGAAFLGVVAIVQLFVSGPQMAALMLALLGLGAIPYVYYRRTQTMSPGRAGPYSS
jgi:amino acid transporter